MAEKDKDEGLDAMMDMWQQGQEAFLKAQADIAEQFRNSLNEMAGSTASGNIDPMAAWQALIKSWAPAWSPSSSGQSGFDYDFRKGNEAFFELLDPQKWTRYAPEQLRVMLEKIARGPQFADLVMPQQKAAEAWREVVDYQEAASEMSQVMQEAWTKAYSEYSKTHTLDDLKTGDINEALNVWLKCANASLLDAQASPDFLQAQKKMLRASTEIRARQRDMAESWSEAWQMPTRTELDDLTLMIHNLRRELREVKRELAHLKGSRS